MRMRTFSAERLHQALASVREEFGPDALILDRQQDVDADGNKVWVVRAALERPAVNSEPAPVEADETVPPTLEHGLQRSMQQLQRLMDGLERSEAATLRARLASDEERVLFDELMRRGVAATHAAALAPGMQREHQISASFLHWGNRLTPEKERRSILISGPSGAGKTTIIAGLATHFHLKGHDIAFVSTDTERMGGLESLQAYAALLNAPVHALRSADEADEIRKKTESARLLLIDTQGWSPTNRRALVRQEPLWDALAPDRRMLLLPASMDEADGMAMLDAAGRMQVSDLLPGKLDETSAVGKVVNWAAASGLALGYCSFGPAAPDHLGWLSPRTLFTLLAGKTSKETA